MGEYHFTTEQELQLGAFHAIEQFWIQQVQCGKFIGTDGVCIAYAYVLHPASIGSIVISSGRIECFLKYKELIFDLFQNGYSVFIHDHRGQGLSGRMLSNTQLGYVKDFDDYVIDFHLFVEQVVSKYSQQQPLLLCHSMGAAIGALHILRHPTVFKKAVFCAPMFGIRPTLPKWLASILLAAHTRLSSESNYFWGQRDYLAVPFMTNSLTHSAVRYDIFRQLYRANPNLMLGGVTSSWLSAALRAMKQISLGKENFAIPALIVQAGNDLVVSNKAQNINAARINNIRLVAIDKAKHELLMEQDLYRNQCLCYALDFLKD